MNSTLEIHKNAWLLNYLFPNLYSGAKLNDGNQFPTNTCTLSMERTIKPHNGAALIFFSPVNEANASYLNPGLSNNLSIGQVGEYIVYADSAGNGINTDANGIIENLSTWGHYQGPSYNKLSAYKQIRIIGASIEVYIQDVERFYSGIVETCLGFEANGNGLKNDMIDVENMDQYPDYRTFKPQEEIILKYRYNNKRLLKFGPYEPYMTIPFHLIKASGLSDRASVRIKTTVHVEGILMPRLSHFATYEYIRQNPHTTQEEYISKSGDPLCHQTVYNKDESLSHHEKIRVYPHFGQDNDIGLDTYVKKKQKVGKIIIDDPPDVIPTQPDPVTILGKKSRKSGGINKTSTQIVGTGSYDLAVTERPSNNELQIYEPQLKKRETPDDDMRHIAPLPMQESPARYNFIQDLFYDAYGYIREIVRDIRRDRAITSRALAKNRDIIHITGSLPVSYVPEVPIEKKDTEQSVNMSKHSETSKTSKKKENPERRYVSFTDAFIPVGFDEWSSKYTTAKLNNFAFFVRGEKVKKPDIVHDGIVKEFQKSNIFRQRYYSWNMRQQPVSA